jgi:hypothetical protein
MVQVIENWALLEGIVESIEASDVRDDLAVVLLAVDHVELVEGYPNLLDEALDAIAPVTIPREALNEQAVEPGARVRLVARKASPFAIFARPDTLAVIAPPPVD